MKLNWVSSPLRVVSFEKESYEAENLQNAMLLTETSPSSHKSKSLSTDQYEHDVEEQEHKRDHYNVYERDDNNDDNKEHILYSARKGFLIYEKISKMLMQFNSQENGS